MIEIETTNLEWNGKSIITQHPPGDPTAESVFHEIFELGIYKSEHCAIKPGDVVIDGGAHLGLFAIYASYYKAAKVICFEPSRKIFPILQMNLMDRPEVKAECYNAALWESSGLAVFREAKQASAGARLIHPGLRNKVGDIFVPSMSIDDLKLEKVDVIKLDIEGCELQALIGAEHTIKRFRPRMMISLYHHRGDMKRLPQLIKSYGKHYKIELSVVPGKHVTGFFY